MPRTAQRAAQHRLASVRRAVPTCRRGERCGGADEGPCWRMAARRAVRTRVARCPCAHGVERRVWSAGHDRQRYVFFTENNRMSRTSSDDRASTSNDGSPGAFANARLARPRQPF